MPTELKSVRRENEEIVPSLFDAFKISKPI